MGAYDYSLELDTNWATFARLIGRLRQTLRAEIDATVKDYGLLQHSGADTAGLQEMLTAVRIGDRTTAALLVNYVAALLSDGMWFILDGPETEWWLDLCAEEATQLMALQGEEGKGILDDDDINVDRLRRMQTILAKYAPSTQRVMGVAENAARS